MKFLTFDEWYEINKDDYPCKADPAKIGMSKAFQQKEFTLTEIICRCENHDLARDAYKKQIESDKKKIATAGIIME